MKKATAQELDQTVLDRIDTLKIGTPSNIYSIGDGTSTDKFLIANTADITKPKIKYDATNKKWTFSNNGTEFSDFYMGGGIAYLTNTFTIAAATNTVNVLGGTITTFNKNLDILFLFVNSVYLSADNDFTYDVDGLKIIKKDGQWEINTVFNIIVLKNVKTDITLFDGTLIMNSTITKEKLVQSLQDKINSMDTFSANAANYVTNDDLSFTETKLQSYTNQQVTALKDGVATDGDTLAKLRGLISGIQTLLNSNDLNLDSLQEVVDYIKNNKTLIDGITTNKVNVSDIINDLTHTDTNKPLSANMGKTLNDAISATNVIVGGKINLTDIINDLIHTDTNKALSANMGKTLKDTIDSLTTTVSGKVNVSDIVNDLIHTDTNKALSANMGKTLKGFIDEINTNAVSTSTFNSGLANKLNIAGGTMTGALIAQNNTDYTVKQVRNVILSTADADSAALQNGDIWFKYV